APFFNEIDLSFHDVITNGSLEHSPWSIYRAEPSDEVDKAWDRVSEVFYFPIKEDSVKRLGKDPKHAVRVPESWGYGKDLYVAQLDGQHLIHCLNVLRKFSHWDYYYPETWRSNGTWRLQSPIDVAHRSHCLSTLLQHLTCQPSLNVITYNWLDGYKIKPFPDFSIRRKCLDHDQILNWQED
ncbi:hypothetical protein DM02DRAFT_504547, partial [Periconia macrospinosa]